MRRVHGVTRTVFVGKRWTIKVPSARYRNPVRGWLANRSEWKQRKRPDVNPVRFTLFYFVSWYCSAVYVGEWEPEDCPMVAPDDGYDRNDERKGSSWGYFRGLPLGPHWRLIDYDRAWVQPRGIVGNLYYGRQERQARRWAKFID